MQDYHTLYYQMWAHDVSVSEDACNCFRFQPGPWVLAVEQMGNELQGYVVDNANDWTGALQDGSAAILILEEIGVSGTHSPAAAQQGKHQYTDDLSDR